MELKINNVSKTYGKKQALSNISIIFKPGVTGLLGPNGAGKSTLMKILSTIENPTSGTVTYNGINITEHPNQLRADLGYLPQYFGIYPNMNAVEFLEYMAAMKGLSVKATRKRIDDLLTVLHLANDKKRLLGHYSGGMKQRVGIAQALLNDPAILIVDEPTVGLDPDERIQFRNLLASIASDRIIILSTHIVTDIESIAPNIALLAHGNLISYTTPEKLMEQVEGKVWNCIFPIEKLLEVQNQYTISSSIQKQDGIHARIISGTKPDLNATVIQPSLEDAYLFHSNRRLSK